MQIGASVNIIMHMHIDPIRWCRSKRLRVQRTRQTFCYTGSQAVYDTRGKRHDVPSFLSMERLHETFT